MKRVAFLILCTRFMYVNSKVGTCQTQIVLRNACPDCCHGSPLTTYSNTMSVISCGKLCSDNPGCLTFQFKSVSMKCWTNRDKLQTVNTSCPDLVEYGEIQEFNCHPHRMFETCDSPTDCPLANSTCLDGRCQCKYGYPYDAESDSCPERCARYGYTLREVPYELTQLNDWLERGVSLQKCFDKCFSSKDFVCRFIEFAAYGACHLSENTALSYPSSIVYGPFSGWKQWERLCA